MELSRLLSAMALEVQALDSPDEAVERIAHYARIAIDATDSGIMLVKARGKVETPAGTSDNVTKAHALQAELDEGPCLSAVRGGEATYVMDDAREDERWPVWGPRCADLGYLSSVSVRLETNDRVYGSLNTYSTERDAFSQQDVDVISLLAAHASVAIASSTLVDDLNTALDSRTAIGQAQGILMAVYDLSDEVAFQYLRRLSMQSNTRLLEVARKVIADRHEIRKNID